MSQATETTSAEYTQSMSLFMGILEKTLGKSLDPLKDLSKTMGSSKFGKNVKSFGGALQSMLKANIQAWALEQLMKLIEPFLKLLELFEIPITALAALFSILVGEIFVELLPYVVQFSKFLMELSPLFKQIGSIIGKQLGPLFQKMIEQLMLQVKNLIPFIELFIKLLPLIMTFTNIMLFFQTIFLQISTFLSNQLIPYWEKLFVWINKVGDFLAHIFAPLWEGIRTGMQAVKDAWDRSGGKLFGKDGFIAQGLGSLVEFAKNIVNGIILTINRIIDKLNDWFGTNWNTIPTLDNGGIVNSPTIAALAQNNKPEAVIPLEKMGNMSSFNNEEILRSLDEQNRNLEIIINQNRKILRWRV